MQFCQLLHKRQTNAGAFVCATTNSLHTMKAVEQARDLVFGNTDAGVLDFQYRILVLLPQARGDAALKGEFEGVRDQVQDDLFHMSRSTQTGSPSDRQSTVSFNPALSTAARNTLARSAV